MEIELELTRAINRVRDLADDRWRQLRYMPDLQDVPATAVLQAARRLDETLTDVEYRLFAGPAESARLSALQDMLALLMQHELETMQAATSDIVPDDEIAAAWQNFTHYRRLRDRARSELREAEALPF